MKNIKPKFALIFALCLAGSNASADALELKNGSLIEGRFIGGTDSEISFQVASSVQKYNLADIAAVKFDSERAAADLPTRPDPSLSSEQRAGDHAGPNAPMYVTLPASTRISVRTIDSIDSAKN